MILINRIGNSITGSYGDKTFGVAYSDSKWEAMLKLEEEANQASSPDELKQILERFEQYAQDDLKTMVESEYPDIWVNQFNQKFYLKVGDKITSIPMPEALVERIKDSIDKGIDINPLIKFWTRWLRNPILRKKDKELQEDFSWRVFLYIDALYTDNQKVADLIETEGLSTSVAEERCSTYQVKITQEGLLCTYKVSREILTVHTLDDDGNPILKDRYKKSIDPDTGMITYEDPEYVEDRLFEPVVMGRRGDAFYCEGNNGYADADHFIKVGCIHRLPDWSYVNTNNNVSCVKGLHVGGLHYINGYQHDGTVTHNVFVDPMHIGAVPDVHHNGDGAIRCLQYFVHSSFGGTNGSIYHSSEYAKKTDQEWIEMRNKIIEDYGELKETQDEEILELESL